MESISSRTSSLTLWNRCACAVGLSLRLNIELDIQTFFGLHVHRCTIHWLRSRDSPPPLPHSYTRTLLVSQDRRHLFVAPCLSQPMLSHLPLRHHMTSAFFDECVRVEKGEKYRVGITSFIYSNHPKARNWFSIIHL
jgi:hypothetical protein